MSFLGWEERAPDVFGDVGTADAAVGDLYTDVVGPALPSKG